MEVYWRSEGEGERASGTGLFGLEAVATECSAARQMRVRVERIFLEQRDDYNGLFRCFLGFLEKKRWQFQTTPIPQFLAFQTCCIHDEFDTASLWRFMAMSSFNASLKRNFTTRCISDISVIYYADSLTDLRRTNATKSYIFRRTSSQSAWSG